EAVHVETDTASAAVAVGAALALVAAGRERAVARAGEDAHADARVVPRGLERVYQRVDGLRAERVQDLRPVDRDPRDAVGRLVEDVVVRHSRAVARADA